MVFYYGRVDHPLHDALSTILGVTVPVELEGEALHDFVTAHARPHWATGDGIIEAAEILVQRAVENANIEPLE